MTTTAVVVLFTELFVAASLMARMEEQFLSPALCVF
uniref:Uncharacterized protein n=1 Tax=Arundo donax TaxID=35708 RepID=A0A0A9GCL9_ARUDO